MANLLVLSFDEIVRSESDVFKLAEETIQLFKGLYPEGSVDYYDLLQEHFSPETKERFLRADSIVIALSFLDKEQSFERLTLLLAEYKKNEVQFSVPHFSLLVPRGYEHSDELLKLLMQTFVCLGHVVNKPNNLAEEFLALENHA